MNNRRYRGGKSPSYDKRQKWGTLNWLTLYGVDLKEKAARLADSAGTRHTSSARHWAVRSQAAAALRAEMEEAKLPGRQVCLQSQPATLTPPAPLHGRPQLLNCCVYSYCPKLSGLSPQRVRTRKMLSPTWMKCFFSGFRMFSVTASQLEMTGYTSHGFWALFFFLPLNQVIISFLTQDRVIIGHNCIYPTDICPFMMGHKY